MRKFEIISEQQWNKDIVEENYNEQYAREELLKPHRGTKHSAGYDFISPISITIPAHGMAKIPTGIKACMEADDVLMIYPRSSIGFKTAIRLANTVGVVDADFYNNSSNEGHIFIKFFNPTDNDYQVNIGDKIAQGIFSKYLVVDDEEEINNVRAGGLGSTGK